mgnify:CR=1 FL=1
MDFYIDPSSLYTPALQDVKTGLISDEEAEKQEEFLQVLREFDALQESVEERAARRARETKAAQESRDKQKRIMELQVKIMKLRSMLSASGDNSIAAELSMAQTELFWLLMS